MLKTITEIGNDESLKKREMDLRNVMGQEAAKCGYSLVIEGEGNNINIKSMSAIRFRMLPNKAKSKQSGKSLGEKISQSVMKVPGGDIRKLGQDVELDGIRQVRSREGDL